LRDALHSGGVCRAYLAHKLAPSRYKIKAINVHGKYIGELLNNRFLPETRTEILNIAQRMRSEDGIEALVLAGTELPLLLRDTASPGIEFLDTTIIHVGAIVDELLR
jgi:aspartate/glutamate racemase